MPFPYITANNSTELQPWGNPTRVEVSSLPTPYFKHLRSRNQMKANDTWKSMPCARALQHTSTWTNPITKQLAKNPGKKAFYLKLSQNALATGSHLHRQNKKEHLRCHMEGCDQIDSIPHIMQTNGCPSINNIQREGVMLGLQFLARKIPYELYLPDSPRYDHTFYTKGLDYLSSRFNITWKQGVMEIYNRFGNKKEAIKLRKSAMFALMRLDAETPIDITQTNETPWIEQFIKQLIRSPGSWQTQRSPPPPPPPCLSFEAFSISFHMSTKSSVTHPCLQHLWPVHNMEL